MRLDHCTRLAPSSLQGVWYRTVDLNHLDTPLETKQTRTHSGRFNPGTAETVGARRFEVLYLSKHGQTSELEARKYFADPYEGINADRDNPNISWFVAAMEVNLQSIVNLTDPREQAKIDMSVQELTGDWAGYQKRSRAFLVNEPTGLAPTQELGSRLYHTRGIEGFLYVSARDARHLNLTIFRHKLRTGSSIRWTDPSSGVVHGIGPRGIRWP